MDISSVLNCSICSPQGVAGPIYNIFNLVLIIIILPIIAIGGIFGCVMILVVFHQRAMRNSTNFYLALLACSDLCINLTAIFLFTLEGIRHYFGPHMALIYARGTPIIFPIGTIMQTCSVYATVAATVDCFILTIFGHVVHDKLCRRSCCWVASCIVTFSVFYNMSHFFETEAVLCYSEDHHDIREEVCATALRFNPTYIRNYYNIAYTVTMVVIPLTLLIALSATIVLKIYISKASFRQNDQDDGTAGEDSLALIMVVIEFVVCNSLASIINFLEHYSWESLGANLNYLVDLLNMLVVVNSSFNILIYYNFGNNFRKTLHVYLHELRLGKKPVDEEIINTVTYV